MKIDWDFWNNPLVVSALRIRFRRNTPLGLGAVLFVAMVALGMFLFRWNQTSPFSYPWMQIYLAIVLGGQVAISSFMAMLAASSSMQAEVMNHTLDFQRIASLSPRKILLGKLLGEGSTAFFLLLTTVPIATYCLAMGATTLPVLVLTYLSMITTVFMFGAIGLQRQVTPPQGNKSRLRGNQGGATWGMIVASIFMMQILGQAAALVSIPWVAAPVSFFTPMLSIYGIMTGTPWNANWDIFGLHIPFLCVTPVTQACIAMLFIQAMRRKLIHPANPPLSKNAAYLILIVVDCLMVGMIRGNLRIAGDGLERMSLFWTVHLVLSLLLALGITPGREALLSWIWRFRGKSPWLTDQLSGTRTANTGALAVFILLGWAIGGLGLVGVDVLVNQSGDRMATPALGELELFLDIGALITLSILLWSTILQLSAVLSGPSSPGMLVGVIVLMVMPLHIAGAWYENNLLLSMTISGQIATRYEDSHAVLPIWPISLLYGGLFFLCLIALRQHLRYHERKVDLKLQQMGVKAVEPAASGML